MEKRPRIVLYGDTLVLAGVQASLEAKAVFEVTALAPCLSAVQELFALEPDIVIFDTGSIQSQFFEDLIHQRNKLLLIGIDPDTNQVLLRAGQQLCGLSVEDLVGVIQKQSHSEIFTWVAR